MVDKTKDTDALEIDETTPKTEEPVIADDITPAPQVDETHQDMPSKSDEDVLGELAKLSQSEGEKGPTRKEATIRKEAKKLESAIVNEIVDFDILSKHISNTPIGQEALKLFAEQNSYDIKEIHEGLEGSNENTRLKSLEDEIRRLKDAEMERAGKKETTTFLDFYKKKVASFDITPVEFDSLYGEEYKNIFSKYAGPLGQKEAANIAFEMTIGKDKESTAKIEAVKKKLRNKLNAASLKPTPQRPVRSTKLMTFQEVSNLSNEDRAAYKKANWNKEERRANYLA